jgi:hypothetical protein
MIAWLVACTQDPAEAWNGSWSVADYRVAVVGDDTETTSTADPAGLPTVDACDAEPVPATFAAPGFDLLVEPLGEGWYVEVHPCESEGTCEEVPWAWGGAQDFGSAGGTARVAGSRFIAFTDGGGLCTLDWWALEIGGTPSAPALSLRTEQVEVALEEGDAVDCEGELEIQTIRPCTGVYLLDGEAW